MQDDSCAGGGRCHSWISLRIEDNEAFESEGKTHARHDLLLCIYYFCHMVHMCLPFLAVNLAWSLAFDSDICTLWLQHPPPSTTLLIPQQHANLHQDSHWKMWSHLTLLTTSRWPWGWILWYCWQDPRKVSTILSFVSMTWVHVLTWTICSILPDQQYILFTGNQFKDDPTLWLQYPEVIHFPPHSTTSTCQDQCS